MGWNGSDQTSNAAGGGARKAGASRRASASDGRSDSAARLSRRGDPTRRSYRRGLLAGIIVVALGGAAVWFMTRPATDLTMKQPKQPKKSQIASVSPHIVTNRPAPPRPKKKKYTVTYSTNSACKVMKYLNGKQAWLYPRNPNDDAKYGVITTSLASVNRSIEVKLFPNVADRHIAYLVNHEPGDEFGDGLYTKGFTQNFLKSLETPIIPSSEDTEEEKALKRAVNEVKIELKQRYDAGEDIEHVIEDTIKTFQELGQYKGEIHKEIDKLSRDPAVTKEEMEKFVEAANEMLKAKGLSNAKVPGAIWKRIERNQKKLLLKQQNQE